MSLPSSLKPLNGISAIRVSTEKQAQIGDSPEDQIEQNQRFASLNNIVISKTMSFAESAAHEYQPMQNVITEAIRSKGKIDVIIIKSIDRFTRGGAEPYQMLKRQLEPYGIKLLDTEGVISHVEHNSLAHLGVEYEWSKRSPSRQAEIMRAEQANEEVHLILTRMIGAEVRYTQLGYYQRAALYGLEKVRVDTQHGKRSIMRLRTDTEGIILRRMYEMRAEGILSDDQICDEMNRMGFATAKQITRDKTDRNRITGERGGKQMYPKLLRKYIQKTLYVGVNTEVWTAGKPVKCAFAPPIDVELWNKANRGKIRIDYASEDPDVPIVTRSAKQDKFVKKNIYNEDFPYRKVVTCPTCKHALLGSASRGRLGKHYPAYHCNNHGHYFRVPKKEFDAVIDNFIAKVEVRPERVDELMTAVMTIWEQKMGQQVEQKAVQGRRKSELEAEMRIVYDRMKLATSPVTLKLMEEDIVKLDTQISQLDEHEDVEHDQKMVDMPTMLTYVKYFMEHLKELLVDHCNPVMKGHYFGVLFDSLADFEKIKYGTANIAYFPEVNELFRIAHSSQGSLVRMRGLEPPQDCSHYHLKVARLPFRHIRAK